MPQRRSRGQTADGSGLSLPPRQRDALPEGLAYSCRRSLRQLEGCLEAEGLVANFLCVKDQARVWPSGVLFVMMYGYRMRSQLECTSGVVLPCRAARNRACCLVGQTNTEVSHAEKASVSFAASMPPPT